MHDFMQDNIIQFDIPVAVMTLFGRSSSLDSSICLHVQKIKEIMRQIIHFFNLQCNRSASEHLDCAA